MIRKPGLGGLLLLGAAAFGAYKYSKMTEQDKKNLKEKGRKLVDENLGSLKNIFGNKGAGQAANANGTTGQSSFTQA
jgi:hypothetical protein